MFELFGRRKKPPREIREIPCPFYQYRGEFRPLCLPREKVSIEGWVISRKIPDGQLTYRSVVKTQFDGREGLLLVRRKTPPEVTTYCRSLEQPPIGRCPAGRIRIEKL